MSCNCSSSVTHFFGIMAQVDRHKFADVLYHVQVRWAYNVALSCASYVLCL